MPTLFDRIIRRTRRWLDAIDRERDLTARQLASRTDGDRAALERRFVLLDKERADVIALIADLERMRDQPPLLFASRPKRVLPPLPIVMARGAVRARTFDRRAKPRKVS